MPRCSEELPPPVRRDRLPKPQQVEKSVGLWSIIKECVGKDLTRVCLPVFFNEPLSALQKSAEDLEYAELLDKVGSPAVNQQWGHSGLRLVDNGGQGGNQAFHSSWSMPRHWTWWWLAATERQLDFPNTV